MTQYLPHSYLHFHNRDDCNVILVQTRYKQIQMRILEWIITNLMNCTTDNRQQTTFSLKYHSDTFKWFRQSAFAVGSVEITIYVQNKKSCTDQKVSSFCSNLILCSEQMFLLDSIQNIGYCKNIIMGSIFRPCVFYIILVVVQLEYKYRTRKLRRLNLNHQQCF